MGTASGMSTRADRRRRLRRDVHRAPPAAEAAPRLKDGELEVTVVDPHSYMTYQPFLPEAAAGNLEPRHVVVSLRRVLSRVTVLNGRVTAVDHAAGRRRSRS